MKKGAVIGIISVLGFIGALILYLSFVGEEGPQKYEDYLGEIQMKVLEASYMAERAMLYSDSAGKYSIYKSLIELGNKGGYFNGECGEYNGYVIWNNCFPERGKNILTENFLEYFYKYFKEYLGSYPEVLIPNDYECGLVKKGNDYVPLQCVGKEEIKIPIILELEGKKVRSVGGLVMGFIIPVDSTKITSCYGHRREDEFHQGLDFSVPVGTPVRAVAAGSIISICSGNCGGYGNNLQIEHGNGMVTQYGHLSSFKVNKGDSVNQGQIIGLSGGYPGDPGAGSSTGPHLDLKFIVNGKMDNSLCYIDNGGLDFSEDSDCCSCQDTRNKKGGCYSGSESITGNVVSNKKKVCLDPGHINDDRGFIGSETEGGNNFKVTSALRSILDAKGYEVFITRTSLNTGCSGDVDVPADRSCRARVANEENCDIFVSIHSDAGGDSASTKAIIYCENGGSLRDYSKSISVCTEKEKESYPLAQAITEELVRLFKVEDTNWKSMYWVNSEIGAIRKHNHPTVLIEMFNHDKQPDIDIYNKLGVERVAEAIANGINKYFGGRIDVTDLDKSQIQLGEYKIKHKFKEEIDYNFEDYDYVIEIVKNCIDVDINTVKNCIDGTKEKFEWEIKEDSGYLLFDVKTDKKFPVGEKYEDVVIRFAIAK